MGRLLGMRIARRAVVFLTLAFVATAVAEARGFGGGVGGRGRQSGRATRRTNSQEQQLVQNAFRRDNVRRGRHVEW